MALDELYRRVRAANAGVGLAELTQRALAGDANAQALLREHGPHVAIGILESLGVLPRGSTEASRRLRREASALLGVGGQDMAEDWQQVRAAEPWRPFLRHILAQDSGAHVIAGPPGNGKTWLARRLAQRWHEETGYVVEYANLHQDDIRPSDRVIPLGVLGTRVGRLALSQRVSTAAEDPDDADLMREPLHPLMRAALEHYGVERADHLYDVFGSRIIVVDEGSSAISSDPQDPMRWTARMALWHGRHVRWLVALIAQMLSPIPEQILGQCTLWAKQPSGREYATDRDNAVVRRFWKAAHEAFLRLRRSPYWAHWPNPRSWCYVESPPQGDWQGYEGLVPFEPPEREEAAA